MNIVIADDEKIILKWLKKNIEEISQDNHIVKSCLNGKEALTCCLNQKIDVLFTDIRMPVMDGLELIKILSDNQIMPYTVILSAYDDFSYARDCFRLGVKEFLLKSEITKENLEECLNMAVEGINSGDQNKLSSKSDEESLKRIVSEIFKNDSAPVETLRIYWDNLGKIKNEFILVILFFGDRKINQKQIEEVATYFFQEESKDFYFIPKEENEIVLITEVVFTPMQNFAKKVFTFFQSFGYKDFFVSASGKGKSCKDIGGLYRQAIEVLNYQIFYGETGGIGYETLAAAWESRKKEVARALDELMGAIANHQWKQVSEKTETVMSDLRKIKPAITDLRNLVFDLFLNIYWTVFDETERKLINIEDFFSINACKKFEKFESKTLFLLDNIISMIKDHNGYSEAVSGVIRYIEQNYSENISLEEIAEYVHMNKNYISHLFKKESGENIYSYILKYRLEKAKKMLIQNNESIQEIASSVGIFDAAYFSRLFKKQTGVSPMEYRKQNILQKI